MNRVAFLGGLILCAGSVKALAQSNAELPGAKILRERLCERPDFSGSDTSHRILAARWQRAAKHNYVKDFDDPNNDVTKIANFDWQNPNTLVVGQFNLTARTPACIAKPYDLYTDNEQEIALEFIQPPDAICSATVAYTDNPPRDYGALVQNLLSSLIGKILGVDASAQFSSIILPSVGVKNTTAAVVLSCKAGKEKDSPTVGSERKINIHYGNVDLLSASAGAVVSTLGKRIYGVKTTTIGKNADGTDKTVSTIAITSSSDIQFVPIGLIDVNYGGNRKLNFNAQIGLGINPNGSSTQVEYFASPLAIGWKGLYFSPGLHIARVERLQGGFALGDTVSSSGFSVPTSWNATYKLGFTISYQPLPKK